MDGEREMERDGWRWVERLEMEVKMERERWRWMEREMERWRWK
jgi:hypothetical protein